MDFERSETTDRPPRGPPLPYSRRCRSAIGDRLGASLSSPSGSPSARGTRPSRVLSLPTKAPQQRSPCRRLGRPERAGGESLCFFSCSMTEGQPRVGLRREAFRSVRTRLRSGQSSLPRGLESARVLHRCHRVLGRPPDRWRRPFRYAERGLPLLACDQRGPGDAGRLARCG